MYQTRNMIDDYFKAGKPMGYFDANQYMSQYYSQPENGMARMNEMAGKAIGTLKGQVPETQTLNGVTYTKVNGQWLAP